MVREETTIDELVERAARKYGDRCPEEVIEEVKRTLQDLPATEDPIHRRGILFGRLLNHVLALAILWELDPAGCINLNESETAV